MEDNFPYFHTNSLLHSVHTEKYVNNFEVVQNLNMTFNKVNFILVFATDFLDNFDFILVFATDLILGRSSYFGATKFCQKLFYVHNCQP